ncbi:hypothetical protein AX16_004708 [Volvariella volvacea WC 439]|nr:hypothetical protein AX16_004708 [Volvariella volvacea WC 439]
MNPRSTIHEHEFHASTRLREYKVTPSTQSLQLPQVRIPQLRSGDTDIDTTDHDVDSNHSSPNDDSTMPKPSRPTSNLVMPSRISATSSHHIHPRSSFEIESRQPDEAHHRVEVIDLEVDGTRPDSLASSQSSLGIPLVQQPAVSSTSSSPLFFSHPHFYRSILPDSPYSYARHDPHNGAPLGLHPIPHPHPHFTPRYRFMGTIGQGSYGKVLLGYRDDDPHEEIRAVKVMPKRHIRRFGVNEIVKELTALRLVAQTMEYSSLEDGGLSGCQMDGDKEGIQFLQKLVESFQDPGYVFIVLEYHPTTLANPETASRFCLVEADTSRHSGLSTSVSLPLSFPESITSSSAYYSRDQVMTALRLLAAELSLGLLFLHNHGLVHQDIKPANIMISADGHAVIGDFGAATALPVLSEAESQIAEYLSARVPSLAVSPPPQSRYGVIILQPEDTVSFTPLYAAPEILERNGEGLLVYDERVDWWSLGVLLHELSTGEVPFRMTGGGGAPLRRSDGDASISYGLLEKLSIHEYGKDGCPMRDSHFAQFVKDLLVEDPEYRLAGSGVKHHAFFSPIENDWEEILALQCPPCPHPTVTTVDTSDTSLHFTPTKGAEGNGEDIHRDADVSEEERHDSLDSGSTTTSSRGSTVSISSSNAAATARTSASANDTTSRTEEIPVNIHTSDTNTHTTPANPLDVDSLFNGAGLRITQLRKVDNLPCEKERLAWRSALQFGAGQYGVFTAASSSPSSSSSGLSWPLSPSPPPSPRYTGPQHSRRSSYDYGHGYSHEFGRSRSRRVGYRRGAGYSPGYRHSRLGFGFGFGVGGYAGRSYLEGLAEVIEEEEGACEGESEGEERRFKEQKLSSDEDPEPWHDDSGLGFLPLTTPPRHKNLKKKTSSLSKEVVFGNGGGSVEIETGLADGASSVSFAGVFGGGGVYDDERRDSVDYEYDSTSESDYEDEDDEGHGGEYGGDAKENERDNDRMFEDRRKEDSQLGDEDHEEELGPDDSISVEKEVGSSGEYTQCVAILKKEDTESVKRSSVSTITGHAEGRESGEWERSERSGGERTEEENQTGGTRSWLHTRTRFKGILHEIPP